MKGLEPIDQVKKRLGMLKTYSKTELGGAFGVTQVWVTRKVQALHDHDYDRRNIPGSVAWELYLCYLYQRQLTQLENRSRVGTKELHSFLNKFDEAPDTESARKEYATAMGGSWEHFNSLLTGIELSRENAIPGITFNVSAQAA